MNAPQRIDDPTLSMPRLLLHLRRNPMVADAVAEHVGNILSRLTNEAQAQLLASELWEQERHHAGAVRTCAARAEALAWVAAALGSAFNRGAPIPFEVPPQWNHLPPERDIETENTYGIETKADSHAS